MADTLGEKWVSRSVGGWALEWAARLVVSWVAQRAACLVACLVALWVVARAGDLVVAWVGVLAASSAGHLGQLVSMKVGSWVGLWVACLGA